MSRYFWIVGLTLGMASVAHAQTPSSPTTFPTLGQATSDPSFYLSLHAGALFLQDATAHIPSDQDHSLSSYDPGFRLGGDIGVDVTRHFSVEGDFSYARAGLNHVALSDDVTGPIWSNPATGGADVRTFTADAIARTQWRMLEPYIGIGGGLANIHSATNTTDQYNDPLHFEDTDQTWAAQAFVGAEYALSSNVSIGARYTAQLIGPFSLYNGFINVDQSWWHSVEITLKYRFSR